MLAETHYTITDIRPSSEWLYIGRAILGVVSGRTQREGRGRTNGYYWQHRGELLRTRRKSV